MTPLRRLFDVICSIAVLVIGLPCFVVIALCIKCSSKGPVFYGSVRMGYLKRPFICWKFRSMYLDAERMLAKILDESPALQIEWEKRYKLSKDERVTKLGAWLRKTALDELPQFWNVLKGEMSIIGPRPVSLEEAKLFQQMSGDTVFRVRPGITGLWQVSRTKTMTYEERICMEMHYVNTHSWKGDMHILLNTIPLVFFPKRGCSS